MTTETATATNEYRDDGTPYVHWEIGRPTAHGYEAFDRENGEGDPGHLTDPELRNLERELLDDYLADREVADEGAI